MSFYIHQDVKGIPRLDHWVLGYNLSLESQHMSDSEGGENSMRDPWFFERGHWARDADMWDKTFTLMNLGSFGIRCYSR